LTEGKFIQVNDLRLYYEEAGSGEALILLHGTMGSSAVWRPYLPVLSPHGRVIVPDLRDHGRTTFTPDFDPAPMAEQNAADIIGLLDALAIERAVLCGWSRGGGIATRTAYLYPDRVRGLIVGGVTLEVTDATRAMLYAMGLDGPGQPNMSRAQQTIPDIVALWQQTHVQTEDHWLRLIERMSHGMLNPTLVPTEAEIAAIGTPTLIVWGDRDQFLPVEQAVTLYRWLPDAQLSIIPNADHFVTRTHQAEFGGIVSRFLATLFQREST
jgi:pimeloyl-ACP methyl ester carboxylesterase